MITPTRIDIYENWKLLPYSLEQKKCDAIKKLTEASLELVVNNTKDIKLLEILTTTNSPETEKWTAVLLDEYKKTVPQGEQQQASYLKAFNFAAKIISTINGGAALEKRAKEIETLTSENFIPALPQLKNFDPAIEAFDSEIRARCTDEAEDYKEKTTKVIQSIENQKMDQIAQLVAPIMLECNLVITNPSVKDQKAELNGAIYNGVISVLDQRGKYGDILSLIAEKISLFKPETFIAEIQSLEQSEEINQVKDLALVYNNDKYIQNFLDCIREVICIDDQLEGRKIVEKFLEAFVKEFNRTEYRNLLISSMDAPLNREAFAKKLSQEHVQLMNEFIAKYKTFLDRKFFENEKIFELFKQSR